MIIIKSQTGSIGTYKLIDYSKVSLKSEKFHIIALATNDADGYEVLAEYESEERAKEVMEEIEEHIRHIGFYKIMAKDSNVEECSNFMGFNNIIFTMPKA